MKTPQNDKTMHQQSSMSTTRKPKGPSKRLIRKLVLYLILSGLLVGYVLFACPPASQTTEEEPVTKEVLTTSQIPDDTPTPTEVPTTEAVPVVAAIKYKLTAYCPCEICCGKFDGITATGVKATAGRTVAVDPDNIPYGSEVVINGHTYIAEDCGGDVKDNTIDIFFDTHQEAIEFGVQYAEVEVK